MTKRLDKLIQQIRELEEAKPPIDDVTMQVRDYLLHTQQQHRAVLEEAVIDALRGHAPVADIDARPAQQIALAAFWSSIDVDGLMATAIPIAQADNTLRIDPTERDRRLIELKRERYQLMVTDHAERLAAGNPPRGDAPVGVLIGLDLATAEAGGLI